MKITAYRLDAFQGLMITLGVEEDAHALIVLQNRVSFIDARVWTLEELRAHYKPADITEAHRQLVLQQFVGYGRSVGLTPAAGVYLKKLGLMQGKDLLEAVRKGMATQAVIKKEAQRMAQEDKDPTASKAPRKLAGAAAAAVKRKEERLAAEAKQLAGQVTEDQTKVEEAGAVDARLPTTTKGGRKKNDDQKPAKQTAKGTQDAVTKGPKITKATPSADQAKKILKGAARKDAQVSATGDFDVAKLKNADGEYKSASAMFKGLLFEGKQSDDAIAKAVDKQFKLGEQKAKDYVKWNRGWFRRQGVAIADSK